MAKESIRVVPTEVATEAHVWRWHTTWCRKPRQNASAFRSRLVGLRSAESAIGSPPEPVGAEKCVLRLDGQPVGLRWVA